MAVLAIVAEVGHILGRADTFRIQCIAAQPSGVEVAANEGHGLSHSLVAGVELDVQVVHVGCGGLRPGQHGVRQPTVVAGGDGHERSDRRQDRPAFAFADLDYGIEKIALDSLDEREILDEENDLLALTSEFAAYIEHRALQPPGPDVGGVGHGDGQLFVEHRDGRVLQFGAALDQHEPFLRHLGRLLDVEDVEGKVVRGEGQWPVRVAFAPVGEQVGGQSRDEAVRPQQVTADMRIEQQNGQPAGPARTRAGRVRARPPPGPHAGG